MTCVALRSLTAASRPWMLSLKTPAHRCWCVFHVYHARSLACVLPLHLQLLLLHACTDRNACSALGSLGCRQRLVKSHCTVATSLSHAAQLQASVSARLKDQIIRMNGGKAPSAGHPEYELFLEVSRESEGTEAAAPVKQEVSTATAMATCAPAGDGLADNSTPVSQDKHAGECLIRSVLSRCPSGLPYSLLLACSLAPCRCKMGRHCTLHLADNAGCCTAGHPSSSPQTGGPVASTTCGAKRRAEAEASAPVCHSRLSLGSLCVSTCTAMASDVQALPHGLCKKGRP